MKRTLLILFFLTAALGACGQYLHLAGDTARTALYLDAGRIWNYNLYEHSRWGGGLLLSTHPKQFIFKQIDAEGYLGYGTFDEQWKYGVSLAEHLHCSNNSVFYQRAQKDYFAAANRHIDKPWSGTSLLSGFMSRRMVEMHCVTLGYRMDLNLWRWAAEITFGKRGHLFDEYTLLYSRQTPIDFEQFGCLRLLLRHNNGFAAQYELFSDLKTMRLLAEYRRSIPLSFLTLDFYAQGGITPKNNAYIDLFDLGGTWDAPVYIGSNFPTVSPNEFTSNTFGLLSMRLCTAKPLYNVYSTLFNVGSNPRPFVGLTALWGSMWGQNADGTKIIETFVLQAPYKGLLEPVVGVDGIVRWGAADLGVALACRITPRTATYHQNQTPENLIFMLSITLAVE